MRDATCLASEMRVYLLPELHNNDICCLNCIITIRSLLPELHNDTKEYIFNESVTFTHDVVRDIAVKCAVVDSPSSIDCPHCLCYRFCCEARSYIPGGFVLWVKVQSSPGLKCLYMTYSFSYLICFFLLFLALSSCCCRRRGRRRHCTFQLLEKWQLALAVDSPSIHRQGEGFDSDFQSK